MKKFLPLFSLLAALILTVAGTVFTAVTYLKPKEQLRKSQYNLIRSSTLQLYQQVVLFMRAGKYREAENLLLRINRRTPGDPGVFRLLGKINYLKGDVKTAAKIFYRLSISDPGDPVLRNNLAVLLAQRGLYQCAARLLLEAEQYSNGARYIQYNLFYVCLLKKKYLRAAKYLQAAQRKSEDPRISFVPAEAIIFSPFYKDPAGRKRKKR